MLVNDGVVSQDTTPLPPVGTIFFVKGDAEEHQWIVTGYVEPPTSFERVYWRCIRWDEDPTIVGKEGAMPWYDEYAQRFTWQISSDGDPNGMP